MATYSRARTRICRTALLTATAAAFAVAAIVGANAWLGTQSHAPRSALRTTVSASQAHPQQAAVQAAAAPVPTASAPLRSRQDASLVLVTSGAQAVSAEQSLDQADALRATLGLTAINASIVVVTGDQTATTVQAIAAADALRGQWGVPPMTVVDLR